MDYILTMSLIQKHGEQCEMTGYDEELTVCSHCKRDIVIAFYGSSPAYSILCPDCTQKAKQDGQLDHIFKWKTVKLTDSEGKT